MSDKVAIYKSADGKASLEVRLEQETVWLRQKQMAELFGRERSVITRHINNVFHDGELEKKSNVQNMHIANSDKPVAFYNLDVIISVGYRVKSQRGTQFRKWATQVLRSPSAGLHHQPAAPERAGRKTGRDAAGDGVAESNSFQYGNG